MAIHKPSSFRTIHSAPKFKKGEEEDTRRLRSRGAIPIRAGKGAVNLLPQLAVSDHIILSEEHSELPSTQNQTTCSSRTVNFGWEAVPRGFFLRPN